MKMKCKRDTPRNEKEFITGMLSKIEDDGIRYRLSNLIVWYTAHAKKNKWIFYILNITAMLVNAFIPVLNIFSENENIPISKIVTIMATVAALAMSFNNFFHFKDKWTQYRTAAEKLKELMNEYVIEIDNMEMENMGESAQYKREKRAHLTRELLKNIKICTNEESCRWKNIVYDIDKKNDT